MEEEKKTVEEQVKEILKMFATEEPTYYTKMTWNTTNTNATLSKMLYHLEKGNLYRVAREVFDTKFQNKEYMGRFMEALDKLNTLIPIDLENEKVKNILIQAIEETNQSFNLYNYRQIVKEGLIDDYRVLMDFDDSFRGTIKKIHKVNEKYIVIETRRDAEDCFYVFREGSMDSEVYHDFEGALFSAMCKRYGDAMFCLFKNRMG